MLNDHVPPPEALFVVTFDQKIGYKILWQKSASTIDLSGVEFKALPSGVHEVETDVIYFSHDDYIGLNAFARASTTAEHRHAAFVGVGCLVRQAGNGLGGIWKHIEHLRPLAQILANDMAHRAQLEDYWAESHSSIPTPLQPNGKDAKLQQAIPQDLELDNDSLDDASLPAMALKELLVVFGPLAFALQRAALLRRRILFVGHPPVHQMCNFVYCTSLLTLLSTEATPATGQSKSFPSYQLLFNVGIADIDQLSKTKAFVACTSDTIIADKPDLYDVLVKLPRSDRAEQRWPSMQDNMGNHIKATERDAIRYRALAQYLSLHSIPDHTYRDDPAESDIEDSTPLISKDANGDLSHEDINIPPQILEDRTWASTAYKTIVRWTSADIAETSESSLEADTSLLQEFSSTGDISSAGLGEVLTIQKFCNHFNKRLFEGLAELASTARSSESAHDVLMISPLDLQDLGLDMHSKADRAFVEQVLLLYHGREAKVVDDGVRLCGVRIC